MRNLSNIGRLFYGAAIAEMGVQTLYYNKFPYMLIPEKHSWVKDLVVLTYLSGILLLLAGACIILRKRTMSASLLLGTVLLLIFCFYFIPYELVVSPNYMHFGDWENSAKELALCGGAFVIAGVYPEATKSALIRSLKRLAPLGVVLFALTIISFAVDHFLYAKEAADYVPAWVPRHVFVLYFTGAALLLSGMAILLNIRRGLAAVLLGTMILIWVIILHIPRIIVSPRIYLGGELTSAFIALAYCGIAFVIAGARRLV